MMPRIILTTREQELDNLVVIVSRLTKIPSGIFSSDEKRYIREQVENRKRDLVTFNRLHYHVFLFFIRESKNRSKRMEECRKGGDQAAAVLNGARARRVAIFDGDGNESEVLAFAEGMSLGSYQFLKYKNDREEINTLEEIEIYLTGSGNPEAGSDRKKSGIRLTDPAVRIGFLNILSEAVSRCRDLINEPNSHLTATGFAGEVTRMATDAGLSIEVMNKTKIASLKMGGLLGVNQGSHEPPTFTVLEWKPAGAVNEQPVVLVGKGVIYDTGGMNIKTGGLMLNMKDDMSGAAAVAATLFATAKAQLPVYVVGLMPATDNRPGEKAMVSGDILTMHNGMTVEVIDTDAEGRLILADALSYAARYKPALVIDLATLTGSAVRAIGKFAAAAMQAEASTELGKLKEAGDAVYERLVEFPMWEEYGEWIKSDIADIKNLGPPEAGLITAAKFLQKFTSYPYIHLDIAGPAFLEKRDGYRGQGGTGFGVRLLFGFLLKVAMQAKA